MRGGERCVRNLNFQHRGLNFGVASNREYSQQIMRVLLTLFFLNRSEYLNLFFISSILRMTILPQQRVPLCETLLFATRSANKTHGRFIRHKRKRPLKTTTTTTTQLRHQDSFFVRRTTLSTNHEPQRPSPVRPGPQRGP